MIKKNYTQTELKLPTNEVDITKKSYIEKPNQSKSLSIKKDDSIKTNVTDLSKVPSKTSTTHLIKSDNLKQHTNPTSSLAQDTISSSGAKQNESISQNIPKITKILFDTQKPLNTIQVENTKQSQNHISNTLINKSVNNQSKSNKELTINDDNQVHPNIKLKTDPKTEK